MSPNKIVLCTGANQGLGYYVLQVAGLRYPEYTFILGSRDLEKGKEAAKTLKEAGVESEIDVVQLDVLKDDDISAAVAYVEKKYGKLDVLVNNAGILGRKPGRDNLAEIRAAYDELLSTNLTSVAVVTEAFTELLYKSQDPKVISISSGLGSMHNALTKKMGRFPPYGCSKIGLNGLMVHFQVAENDRVKAGGVDSEKPRIRYYVCQPGALHTSFSNYHPGLRMPDRGAEVIVRLVADDEKLYEGGSYWEYEDDKMKQVPW
ncbi:short chain dehydrogenase/reductase family protein [Xylariaceae sp. FL1019]|nr:short chain dehydrogenase/reductase family protein [Xylariaceae sp. FL1019]